MTRWLYDSDGDPVAFLQSESVFSSRGDYLGKLDSDQQVWNGEYIGEIIADDRFVFNTKKLFGRRKMPGIPRLPGFHGEAPFKGAFTVPLGYRDVDIK
jgi:hypothetical protein